MPRRMPDYPTAMSCWNAISSYGSVVSLFSIFFAWHTWLEGANYRSIPILMDGSHHMDFSGLCHNHGVPEMTWYWCCAAEAQKINRPSCKPRRNKMIILWALAYS
eukprot:TRINITY_DN50_c0_g1_i27.p1 TRINITY_DN50_c0_g1~~TRINITY_DN50_c0_g1_i27.p1  ORF type:complete len:105 (-),score=0.42 TRINITY_DN50_c0_g1_i27:119-433(-)